MKTALIINSHSRRGANKFKSILRTLENNSEVLYSQEVTDTTTLASHISKALQENPTHLFVGGGDGTVMCASQAIAESKSKIILCVIPLGTGNYFARNIKIGIKNINKTIKSVLNSQKTKDVYIGQVNDRYFNLMADIGISSEVSKNIDNSHKKRLGILAYATETFKYASRHEAFDVTIESEKDTYTFSTHQLIIAKANINEHIRLAPTISLEDDELLVVSYSNDKNLMSHLKGLGAFMLTGDVEKSNVFAFRFKELRLTTEPSKNIALDGEPLEKTPATIKVCPHPITVAIV